MTKTKRFGVPSMPVASVEPWQPSYASLLVAGAVMGGIVVSAFFAFPWAQWAADWQFSIALMGN